jgi:pimeloyl-ACP methyl ester carboxylesterase
VTPSGVTLVGAEGNRLAADRYGPWPAARHALLAHGGGQTRHAWGATARALARAGFTSLAVDQRGHGDSDWLANGAYAFDDYAADMAAMLARLAEEAEAPPAVVGASLGGIAGLIAIGERGAPASALVLVDVAPSVRPDGIAAIRGFMAEHAQDGFASLDDAADAIARYLPHRPRPRSLDGLRKNLRHGADGRWRWHWDPRFIDGPRSIDTGREAAADRLRAATAALRVPVLLVRGSSSEVLDQAAVDEFRGLAPHAEVADVQGARHMVAGDRNDAFGAAVVAFVARAAG